MDNKTKAEELFELRLKHGLLEDEVFDELLKCCDIDPHNVDLWPFNDWTYDYDKSFEVKHTKIGWRPTFQQLKNCWELGFERCWICYTDNTEIYYIKEMTEEQYNNAQLKQL